MLAPEHYTDTTPISPGDIDDIGNLACPINEAAVDVDAQIV